MSDYKKSLNLPDTSFPMKANLTQREPEMLRWWEENNIYGTMLEASGSRGSFRLHDGPPYANGHLHLGHHTLLTSASTATAPCSRTMTGLISISSRLSSASISAPSRTAIAATAPMSAFGLPR